MNRIANAIVISTLFACSAYLIPIAGEEVSVPFFLVAMIAYFFIGGREE